MATAANSVRWATSEDISLVSENARDADRLEWALMWPEQSVCIHKMIEYSVRTSSLCLTGCHDDTAVALFGITQQPGNTRSAAIWAICTHQIENPSMYYGWYKISHRLLPKLGTRFHRLENLVQSKNFKAIRFIKHIGFTLSPDTKVLKGEKFIPFHMDFSVSSD